MKKSYIIVALVVGLIVGGGVGFFAVQNLPEDGSEAATLSGNGETKKWKFEFIQKGTGDPFDFTASTTEPFSTGDKNLDNGVQKIDVERKGENGYTIIVEQSLAAEPNREIAHVFNRWTDWRIGARTTTSQPDKLHFGFCLNIRRNDNPASAALCIGKGQTENYDNWWIGGPDGSPSNWEKTGNSVCTETIEACILEVEGGGGESNKFFVIDTSTS
ncbi:MAG: hypothetical protein ABEK59_11140 [Halobacteria archaeon]